MRPFAGEDVSHLDPIHGSDRDPPRRARTFVAVADDAVVGAGTLLWSGRHPDLVAAAIDVDGSMRRRGIGSALLRHLEAEADRPLLFNVERAGGSTRFLESTGFTIAVTSVTCRVLVHDALAALRQVRPSTVPGLRIDAATGISGEVAELYEDIYRARHAWAGRYSPPADAPWIGFAGPPIGDPGAVQVARAKGHPVSVASLHGGHFAAGADAFLAPTSVLRGGFDERVEILSELLRAVLGAALSGGVRAINVEVDTPYDDLAALVASWPATGHVTRDAWLRT